jgi:hypothetical protein
LLNISFFKQINEWSDGGGVMRFFFLSAGHNAFSCSAAQSEFNFESAGDANLFECSSTEGAF